MDAIRVIIYVKEEKWRWVKIYFILKQERN